MENKELHKIYLYIYILTFTFVYVGHSIFFEQTLLYMWFNTMFASVGPSLLLIGLFNTTLWKKSKYLKDFLKVPDISGRWVGHLKSSFDNFGKETEIVVEIKQSLTKISLKYHDEYAIEDHLACNLILKEGDVPKLVTLYRNQPINASRPGLNSHLGAMQLTIFDDEISGIYFNYPKEMNTYGEIRLKRCPFTHP